MSGSAKNLLLRALDLPSSDRAELIDSLIISLEKPDSRFDALWLKEAKDRLDAYTSGELEAFDAEEVFAELGKTA